MDACSRIRVAALLAGSTALAQLPTGSLVTVLETEGDFLHVLTSDDSFGYIPRSTGMAEVDPKDVHGER